MARATILHSPARKRRPTNTRNLASIPSPLCDSSKDGRLSHQHISIAITLASKLVEIKNWGAFSLGTPEHYTAGYDPHDSGYFSGARNLTISATDMPNLDGTRSLSGMFDGCRKLERVPSINQWDVSSITNMSQVFAGANRFNQDISAWDTSSVTDMSAMFNGAEKFDQDIGGWDVSKVTDMSSIVPRDDAF